MYGDGRHTTHGDAYKEMAVLGSTPERLIPLLYEHLLVNLKRGSLGIRRGNLERKVEGLSRARAITFELLRALDREVGGDLASRLHSLYGFWIQEISDAGRAMDAERIDRVADMVSALHASWSEAVRLVEAAGPRPDGRPA